MKCGSCGGSRVAADTRDVEYVYKGQSTMIRAVKGDYCPDCDEVIFNRAQSEYYGAKVRAFHRRVNAVSIDPAFIVNVRTKLALDQREAGELFGGGVNAFSRYETGTTQPPVALVKLLGLLDRHPELLAEVREQ
jgi:HTH-type transcriptional regulator / antitoxin MqsA